MDPDSIFHSPGDVFYVNAQAGEIRLTASRDYVGEAYLITGASRIPMNIGYQDSDFDYFVVHLAPFDTAFSYSFLVFDKSDSLRVPAEGNFRVTAPALQVPDWAAGQNYYFIHVDGFHNGDVLNDPDEKANWLDKPTRGSAYGGDLEGIFQKMDYIKELDPDIIILSPIFEASSNHKLGPRDYARIDPVYGDTNSLKRLIAAVHDINKRIILSVITTHTGVDFPAFVDISAKGNRSNYADWYQIKSLPTDSLGVQYNAWLGDSNFPLLNLRNLQLRDYLIGFVEYWAHFGFDGFYIGEHEAIDPGFMATLYRQIKDKYPEIIILNSDCRLQTVLHSDGCMNRMLSRAAVEYFVHNTISTATFDSIVHNILFFKPSQINCSSLIGFHDYTQRIGMIADQDLLDVMYAFIFTFCGSPIIVYGDETGSTESAPLNWGSFNWSGEPENLELMETIRSLMRIRRENPEISSPHLFTLYIDDVKKVYSYDRGGLIVVLNSGTGQSFVELPAWDGTYIDLMAGTKYTAFPQRLRLSVDPLSFRILKREL